MEPGLRVVRGKDWKWKDQDGGEGSVGTIVEVGVKGGKIPKNVVVVIWDTGVKANYRAGHQGADDLRVLDNAASGVRHVNVTCDICKESKLTGTRWKCEVCHNFDLCYSCYMGDKHDLSHTFTRWDTPLSNCVKVSARKSSRKVSAKGIYAGAKVVRGTDWSYKNQDGGPNKQGVVQSIGGSSEDTSWRSWVKVRWDIGLANDYRRGHQGLIDVKCVQAASGESYYVDHLADLGTYAQASFCTGDPVKVNESLLSAEQKIRFAPILGYIGKTIIDKDSQKILIQFPGQDSVVQLPTSLLMKAQVFRKGDTVMISNDRETVIRLQQGHGGWNDQMKQCLGMEAEVIGKDSDGDVKVSVKGLKWILNPECCTLLTRGSGDTEADDDNSIYNDDDDDDDDDDETSNLGAAFLNTFLKEVFKEAIGKAFVGQALGPTDLIRMAAEGRLEAVKVIIKNYPGQIDIKVKDMTALQVAAHQGHLDVVIALANAGARLEMQDSNGDNVLHFATIGGKEKVLEVLLKHKPNLVDVQNSDNRTCLHLAVIKQFPECLKVLLNYKADVNIQDKDGATAVQVAVEKPDVAIQDQLINHPKTDFKLKDAKGFNVIHLAALKNNVNALRKLTAKAPTLVNVAKSDGFTALHIATLNAHKDAAEVLISMGRANVNMQSAEGFTPLLLAVNQGRSSMIEFLLSKGADINAEDKDGDTALHLAVNQFRQRSPSSGDGLFAFAILNIVLAGKQPKDLDQAPIISKICTELPSSVQQHRSWVAICCFLLQNGADLDKSNHSGKSVSSIISDDLKKIFKRYVREPARPRQVETPIRQGTTTPSFTSPSSPSSSQSKITCMMCLSADADMIFYPCGHKVTCSGCSGRMKSCFSCHAKIQEKVKSEVSEAPLRQRRNPVSNNAPSPESQRRSRLRTMGRDSVNCPMCEMNVRNVVFLCGHSCCKDCSDPLVNCHICSQPIIKKLNLM